MQIIMQPNEIKPYDFNFEELKNELKQELEKYQNLVVVEEDLPKYKQDRANLNKLDKALNDERIRIERKHNEPFQDFKQKIEILRKMVKEPVDCLDDQLKKFEEKRKEEKKAKIEEKFNELNDIDQVKLSMVWNDSWLNSSVTMKKISDAISEFIEKIHAEIQAITDFQSDFEDQLQALYLKTFDLTKVLAKKNELDAAVAQAEAKRKAQEAEEARKKELEAQKEKERIEKEAQAKLDAINAEIEQKKQTLASDVIEVKSYNSIEDHLKDNPVKTEFFQPGSDQPVQQQAPEPLHTVVFKATGTKDQLMALKAFCKENKIELGRA